MAAVEVAAAVAVVDGVAVAFENEADVVFAGVSQFLSCRGGRKPGAGVLVRKINSEKIILNYLKVLLSITKVKYNLTTFFKRNWPLNEDMTYFRGHP